MSGFMEWARFWILLGARQEWTEDSGKHCLWIRTGGSAGHAGLHHLDVVEGKRSDTRRPQMASYRNAYSRRTKTAQERKQRVAEEHRREQIERTKERIVNALGRYPNGETERTIRDTAGVDSSPLSRMAFAELLSDGDIIPCDVQRTCRKTPYPGYKLADRPEE